MNAVKNCLVVLAAAVALASCSADPNSSSAGKVAVIAASPASLNMQVGGDSTATLIVSAQDALGGAVNSSFTVNVPAGSGFTVAVDGSYLPTSAGSLSSSARLIVNALAASDGFFTVNGGGTTLKISVRVAPRATGTALSLTGQAPQPGDVDTVTAPSGTLFIGPISVTNAKGDSASARQGLAPAGKVGFNADSSKLFFVAAPKAHGHLAVVMANRSTSSLTYTVVSSDSLVAATYDTQNVVMAFSTTTPNFGDTVTVTAPAQFRWGASSMATTPVAGGIPPVVVGFSPDSTQIKIVAGPSASGKVKFTTMYTASPTTFFPARSTLSLAAGASPATANVTFANATPGAFQQDTAVIHTYKFLPGVAASFGGVPVISDSLLNDSTMVFVPVPGATGAIKFVGVKDPRSSPVSSFSLTISSVNTITVTAAPLVATFSPAAPALNVQDTIVLPAGFKFRPTSGATSNGRSGIVISISADSTTMVVVPTPGTNGPVTITHILAAAAGNADFPYATSNSLTVGAIADLGGDDPAGTVPVFNLPAKANYGFWDLGSFGVEDQSDDAGGAGINSQVYRLVLGVAGTIVTNVGWDIGRDVDVMLLADSNTTASTTLGGLSGATSGNPETQNSGALTAGTYLLDLIDWGPAYPDTPAVGATIRIAITVK